MFKAFKIIKIQLYGDTGTREVSIDGHSPQLPFNKPPPLTVCR